MRNINEKALVKQIFKLSFMILARSILKLCYFSYFAKNSLTILQ